MAYRAKIDHDGVYWGVEEVAALAAGDLEVPADCDCKPGAYRLMPAVGDEPAYLEPIEPQNIKAVAGAPTLEQAFYALLTEGRMRRVCWPGARHSNRPLTGVAHEP